MDKKISKIVIDRDTCIGAATCVVLSPDAFDLDAEGIAITKPGAKDVDYESLLIAAQSCPTQAITLFDDAGNKII